MKFFVVSKLSNPIFSIYKRARKNLCEHKRLSLVLSHGGIHLIVLVGLIIIVAILLVIVYRSSHKKLVVIESKMEFEDSSIARMHPLTRFQFSAKRIANNMDSITIKTFHDKPFKASEEKFSLTWKYVIPNERLNYHCKTNVNGATNEQLKKIHRVPSDSGFVIVFDEYSLYPGIVTTSGNLFGENKTLDINPFCAVLFKIKQDHYNLYNIHPDSSSILGSEITIDLTPTTESVIIFENIYPKPDEISINKFSYKGKESVERVFKNGGFYFEAKDTLKTYKAERYIMVMSVFLGTIIAFCLDIIIKLIYKWRRLDNNE